MTRRTRRFGECFTPDFSDLSPPRRLTNLPGWRFELLRVLSDGAQNLAVIEMSASFRLAVIQARSGNHGTTDHLQTPMSSPVAGGAGETVYKLSAVAMRSCRVQGFVNSAPVVGNSGQIAFQSLSCNQRPADSQPLGRFRFPYLSTRVLILR